MKGRQIIKMKKKERPITVSLVSFDHLVKSSFPTLHQPLLGGRLEVNEQGESSTPATDRSY
uniref:Uncharacterized protein n=1 Tax=Cucumis melo TaxID=3656 RepID=A0A9I9E6D2_CUCME